ncbi:MAG: hypothetical protein UHD09_02135 [Bifidobacterium sp.]|nr:hypothetical protein [Bifidobacterium sp.]
MNDVLKKSVGARRKEMLYQCRQVRHPVVFSHVTQLRVLALEVPFQRVYDESKLHGVVAGAHHRRFDDPQVVLHTWNRMTEEDIVQVDGNVRGLRVEAAIASVAKGWDELQLCLVMDSAIRWKLTSVQRLTEFARTRQFHGKRKYITAVRMIQPGGFSIQEDRLQLELNRRNVPMFQRNYVVEDARFESGVPMSLDLALPDARVGMEYQGDQHRTDRAQYQRDLYKNNTLRARNWTIFEVTNADLNDQLRLDQCATDILRIVAQRTGMDCAMQRMSWNEYADHRRPYWKRAA